MNVSLIGQLPSGKNKVQYSCFFTFGKGSINNVFLLAVCFTHQTFDAVSVMRALE